ncbi:tape measure protein [Bacillus safensis]|uniref:tape measure protein n=1 Tax=Bacillus safensis TaxID=561879 RepID=UPI00227FD76A|nr:tape measure protein [Bacillus safensis]MCY7563807.1 tape measure protein [Bacillus safensis]MCY7625483.1 tape measure protein [Bacillus safensis]MCY7632423.1 tape measure protein [Bacillus safensis]MCY7646835.1 tape measure protein [Bacillus safensis]MCY7652565.1 tape measure protein [Bacillus safensis]
MSQPLRTTAIELKLIANSKPLQQMNTQVNSMLSSIQGADRPIQAMSSGLNNTSQIAAGATRQLRLANGQVVNLSRGMRTASQSVSTTNTNINTASRSIMRFTRSTDTSARTIRVANSQLSAMRTRLEDSTSNAGALTQQVNRMGGQVGGQFQQMTQSASRLGGVFGRIPSSVSSMSRSVANSVKSGITAPFREAKTAVQGYAGALGLLSGGALAATGMGRLSAIEQAKTSLSVLMGDAKKAQSFLDDMLTFAKTTPYAFTDIANSGRNLIAFGMDVKNVIPTMQAVGDAAAASGKGAEGFRQISDAFGAMQVSGTLSMEEMNRLMDAGIPALKILANETGQDVMDLKKVISKGAFESEEAIAALVKGMQKGTKGAAGETAAMAGIMKDSKDTWVGSVDSMKSSISSTMAKIMEPAKPHIQAAMGWFSTQFSKLPDVIFGLGKVMQPAFNTIGSIFKNISGPAQTAKQAIMGVFGVMQGKGTGDRLEGYGILSQLFPPSTVDMIVGVTDKVKSVFDTVKASIAGVSPYVQAFILSFISTMKSMAPVFSTIFNGLLSAVQFIAPYIGQALGGVFSFLASIGNQVSAFWKENGIQIVQALQNVFSVLQKVFVFLMPIILTIVQSVWGNIKGVITGALNIIMGIVKIFTGLFTGDFGKMWEGVKQLFFGAVSFIWNGLQLLFIGRIVKGIMGLAKSVGGLVAGMWNGVKSFFVNGATNASNLVVNMGKMIVKGWSFVKNNVGRLAGALWDLVKKKFGDMVEGAKALPGKIGKGIKSMASKAVSGVKSLGNMLAGALATAVNGVTGGINWVLEKIGLKDVKIPKWTPPKYANGTNGHPGGPAILGDGGGPELYKTPSGHVGLSPGTDTLMNLPKGTQVLSHKQTLETLGNVPMYADGTKGNKNGSGWLGKAVEGAKNVVGKVKSAAFDVWDYISNPTKLMNKAFEKFGGKVPSLAGGFGDIAKGLFTKVKDGVMSWGKKKIESFGGMFGGGGSAAVKKWVAQAISIKGISPSYAGALQTIAMKESGGNPNVVNRWDSNWKAGHPSQGLMQFIPSTFASYKEPGYGNIKNPVHQIIAAINYLNRRYGGIYNHPGLKSMAKGGPYKGYATGGRIIGDQWAMVGEQGPELMRLSGGSTIYNNRRTNSMLNDAAYTPSSSSTTYSNSSNSNSFSPTIYVQVSGGASSGSESSIKQAVQEALDEVWSKLNPMYEPEGEY